MWFVRYNVCLNVCSSSRLSVGRSVGPLVRFGQLLRYPDKRIVNIKSEH